MLKICLFLLGCLQGWWWFLLKYSHKWWEPSQQQESCWKSCGMWFVSKGERLALAEGAAGLGLAHLGRSQPGGNSGTRREADLC